jgi:hypothetical protein
MVVTLSVYRYENPAPVSGFPRLPAIELETSRSKRAFVNSQGMDAHSDVVARRIVSSDLMIRDAAIRDDRTNM